MKQKALIITTAILTILTLGIGIYNLYHSTRFLEASATQILTLLIALYIAFWANQYKNDLRNAKGHVERILLNLQQIVVSDCFCTFPADGDLTSIQKATNIMNRKIANYLRVLKEYGKTLKFSQQIEYIENQFVEYKNKVGEHISDLDYLSKTESEFRKIAENINSKCEDIILLLYK